MAAQRILKSVCAEQKYAGGGERFIVTRRQIFVQYPKFLSATTRMEGQKIRGTACVVSASAPLLLVGTATPHRIIALLPLPCPRVMKGHPFPANASVVTLSVLSICQAQVPLFCIAIQSLASAQLGLVQLTRAPILMVPVRTRILSVANVEPHCVRMECGVILCTIIVH